MVRKIVFCFLVVFSLCCMNLCAEINSAQDAQIARETFVVEAKKLVGSPYQYGAIGPDSFDCSGLIYYTASHAVGIQLPRTAKAIYSYCKRVPDKDREIGDLLFFKTTADDKISHVGIFIGNNQFISAISDGPNSGVIISSLNQDYWKGKYVSTGQFIRSAKDVELVEEEIVEPKSESKDKKAKSFADDLIFDSSIFMGWSLFSPNQFMFKFRGVDIQANARYSKMLLQPGVGLIIRFNTSENVFQMPIIFSATVNDYVRFYAGPVISFGNATLIGTDTKISPSVFPGIIGASLTTPYFELGKLKLQVVQDISYTVFNKLDNSALNILDTLSAGLVMYTGIKVTIPMSVFR